jgi:hypothetical protein
MIADNHATHGTHGCWITYIWSIALLNMSLRNSKRNPATNYSYSIAIINEIRNIVLII